MRDFYEDGGGGGGGGGGGPPRSPLMDNAAQRPGAVNGGLIHNEHSEVWLQTIKSVGR